MKQNKMFFLFMELLVIGILSSAILLCRDAESRWPVFIVSALAALGTCGVTILSIFPYKHKDKLNAILYRRGFDNQIMLKVINKTDHPVRLGASNLPLPHEDNFILWWKLGEVQSLENARPIMRSGVGLVIPPYDCVFFLILPEELEGESPKNIIMQVRTNTGYKCDVKNEL